MERELREDLVAGRNAVAELLRSDREIQSLYIQQGIEKNLAGLIAQGRKREIPIKDMDKSQMDRMVPGVPHQGIVAQTAAAQYSQLEDIFKKAGEEAPFIVLCDGITDPHNLGAIIRSAEAAGAHGVIIPKRRSAGLSYVVSKASAGAVEHIPIVRVTNLVNTMRQLKEQNLWFYAADLGGTPWVQQDYSGGVGLVVGAEGEGVSRLVKETCDFTVSLPMLGKVQSLNASVATGIVLYEIARQRMGLSAVEQ